MWACAVPRRSGCGGSRSGRGNVSSCCRRNCPMPVNPTYPGVYIEEIPSGVRTIRGVATSIAAFIGTFRKGLLDEAVQIFSLADFEREYGGLERNSETTYAIQQFFLNGGTEAWVVRI